MGTMEKIKQGKERVGWCLENLVFGLQSDGEELVV